FGLKDSYVAEMKAVILSKCPEVKIVDISHEIDKFNIRMGAFVLASAAPYFPKDTVHVAVVDPGVGTKRHPIIIETKHSYFVGPDNGVLILAASKKGVWHAYVIENPQYMLPKVSKTFHGRDIFASVAAHLAAGVNASQFGKEIRDYVEPDFAKPRLKGDTIFGEVLHIDSFGNIITNILSNILKKLTVRENESIWIEIGKKTATLKLCSAYGNVSLGKALAIVGSHGFLGISVNQGNAAKRFKARCGDSIQVQRRTSG
ncbi:MAG: S-adenosyl-l-methionine hydroxide adenosyltransferase family protein, partial [Candidatus Bathyarchaeota archaeon]|nr:S-adenosyl-l-methionine hydroxide adenosyltransferase family protein [Candidatus Bathyarchaeota archaeon]